MDGAMRSHSVDEALVQVHKTMEPSMEEILASIRSLIAEDSEQPAGGAAPPVELVAVALEEAPMAQEVGAQAPVEPEAAVPRVVWTRPTALLRPIAQPEPQPRIAPEPEALMSAETDDAATSSFAALNAALELQSSDLAERMVGELLRPMLKTWLDENLPSIVEKLVRAEIQRVARGRG